MSMQEAASKELARGRKVRAIVFPIKKVDTTGEESTVEESQLEQLTIAGKVLQPPLDYEALVTLPENNTELNQIIESMEVNIVGFGYTLTPNVADEDEGNEKSPESNKKIKAEYSTIREFLDYGNWDDDSFRFLRKAQRRDYELTGMCFLELTANSRGEYTNFRHIPAQKIRLGRMDEKFTTFKEVREVGTGSEKELVYRSQKRKFRRFVQYEDGTHLVWFKEFGDPRAIDKHTGDVIVDENDVPLMHLDVMSKASLRQHRSKLANELFYRRMYSPRTPYGIPRYIGNMLSIVGGRAAEEINFITFKNNNIPSMMIMVSNGQLTQETIDRITDYSKDVIQGGDNYSRFLVIEAEPDEGVDQSPPGNVKIDVRPLTKEQHTDAMFIEYEKSNSAKVRRAFRTPGIMIGDTSDNNKATADIARKLVEEQVYAPEREEEDWAWNCILRRKGMKYHQFKSNSPNVSSTEELIKVMSAGERSGAITPRIARGFIEGMTGKTLPPMTVSKIELDSPYSAQMADLVKNQAQPSEVGQQVTALKSNASGIEKLYRKGHVPVVRLDESTADMVVAGMDEDIESDEYAEVSERSFALVDSTHVLGFIQLSAPTESENGTWKYRVESIDACTPFPHGSKLPEGTFGSISLRGR